MAATNDVESDDKSSKPQEAAGTTTISMPTEVDDFGLPLKRYVAPISIATDADAESAADGATERKNDVENSHDKTPPPPSAETLPSDQKQLNQPEGSKGDSAETPGSGSDSDDADFKDAQSVLPSDSASSSPRKADQLQQRTSNHAAASGTMPNGSEYVEKDEALATSRPGSETDQPEALDDVKTPTIGPPVTEAAPNTVSRCDDAETRHGIEPASATDQKEASQLHKVSHTRDMSKASTVDGLGISEFSHQPLPAHDDENNKDDGGWQTMPAFARYDMYDDDDRLVAREFNGEDDETYGYGELGGAGKGYTRVLMDEDAQSATSLDDNTKYLFKDPAGTSMAGNEDDEGRDAVAQMQATKDLLTEGQRIAYVGIARLEIAKLVKQGEDLEVSRKTKKEVGLAAESLKMWGQKMMIRVYSHMDISEAEQVMIEQLAEHGVVPTDLTPTLHTNSRVHNPMAKESEDQNEDEAIKTNGTVDGKADEIQSLPEDDFGAIPSSPVSEGTAEPPPPYESLDGEDMPEVKTPSQLPTTDKIDIDLRWTVLCDLFLLLIADSIYDARSRVLLERVGASLDIEWLDICRFEKRVTDALEMQQEADKENWNEDEHMEIRRKKDLKRRYVMMGLATVGGGLVIGLSAGLLAPVIGAGLAAGFTTIGVTGTSSFLAGAGGAAIITSGAAASGSIIGVRAANRRTDSVKTFEYRPLHNNKRVNLIVTVSGWLTGKVDDVRLPFSTVDPIMGDLYSVLWEPEMLRSMGDTINILATEALTQGLQQILGSTILVSLMAALQLPIVLTKLSYLIDNPWAVSLDRAVSAGQIMAASLLERNLGTRPITLVGYSLGSRVIFSCLQELAKRGAYGLVQNVYLFGSPIVVKKEEYVRAGTVVAGRFVNGYNRNDWILGYLFRLTNGGIRRVAGLAAIEDCPWVENVDVSEFVPGHMEYRKAMPKLLMECGWLVESEEFTEIEDPDPDNHQERQRELINEIEEARKEMEKDDKSKRGSKFGIFGRRKKTERQEWEVYEESKGKEKDMDGVKTEGKTEDKDGNNHGVLFDIDAIRAELAKEGTYSREEEAEALQIKEIESTLPPMKLDISPTTPSPASSPVIRDPPRGTQSADALPIRSASGLGASFGTSSANGRGGTPAYGSDPIEDEISMTFDTSFDDSMGNKQGSYSPIDEGSSRPGLKSSHTAPAVAMPDPWGDPDDEDFGKEKEISMTFA